MSVAAVLKRMREDVGDRRRKVVIDPGAWGREDLGDSIPESLGVDGQLALLVSPADVPKSARGGRFQVAAKLPTGSTPSAFGLNDSPVDLFFWDGDRGVEVALAVRPDDDPWHVSSALPVLTRSPLGQLKVLGPRLGYASATPPSDWADASSLTSGLSLAATWTPTTLKAAAVVSTLLSGLVDDASLAAEVDAALSVAVPVEGPLLRVGDDLGLHLRAPLGVPTVGIDGAFELGDWQIGFDATPATGDTKKLVRPFLATTFTVRNPTGEDLHLEIASLWPAASAAEPQWDFTLAGRSTNETTIDNIGLALAGTDWRQLLASAPPQLDAALKRVSLLGMSLSLAGQRPRPTAIGLKAQVIEPFPIAGGQLTVREGKLTVDVADPIDAPAVSGAMSAQIELFGDPTMRFDSSIALPEMEITGAFAGERGLRLSTLIDRLGDTVGVTIPYPGPVPDVVLSEATIDAQPTAGTFSAAAKLQSEWPLGEFFTIEEVDIDIARTLNDDGALTNRLDVTLKGKGAAPIADQLSLGEASITLSYAAGRWHGEGSLAATVLGHDCELAASATMESGELALTFGVESEPPLTVFDLDGIASLNLSSVNLTLKTSGESTTRTTDWKLACEASLAAAHVLDIAGTIELFHDATKTGVAFVADEDEAKIELTLPLNPTAEPDSDHDPTFTLEPERFEIAHERKAGWSVSAKTAFRVTNLPEAVQNLLPDQTMVEFRIDKSGATAAVDKLLDQVPVPIPVVNLEQVSADFADAHLSIDELSFTIGKDLELKAEMAIDLPAEIDNLFGSIDGKPRFKLFNSRLEFDLGIGLESGLSFTLNTPIFNIGEIIEEDGKSWLHLDFGEFGAIRMAPLVFSIDGATNITAKGEFERIRDFKIPLGWLRQLLSGDLAFLADAIPDAIPLSGVHLLNDNDELDVAGFETLLTQLQASTGIDLPLQAIRDTLFIAEGLNRLPKAFREYLNFDIPSYLAFDLEITPSTGLGIRVDVRTRDDEPLRFLMPSGTGFTGVTLRHFGLGEVLSGQLLVTEIDATIDSFDFLTLAAIFMLPLDDIPLLPDTTDIHRRIIIDDLLMVIIWQTIIPIPVPLFFDRLGVESLGLDGLGVGLVAEFPKPSPSLVDLAAVFAELYSWLTTPNTNLAPDVFDRRNMGLTFAIAPGFLELPQYLGGAVLGDKDTLFELSLTESLVAVLNALKNPPSLAEVIDLVPYEHRHADVDMKFGPLRANVKWLAASSRDFDAQVPAALGTGADEAAEVLALARPNQQAIDGTDAAVVFLAGGLSVAGLFALDARFALASSPSSTATGFVLRGELGPNWLSMRMAGAIVIDEKARPVVAAKGEVEMDMFGHRVMTGSVLVSEEKLALDMSVDLFPSVPGIDVRGAMGGQITADDFLLAGSVDIAVGGMTPFISAVGAVGASGMSIAATWLGAQVVFESETRGDMLFFRGELKGAIGGDSLGGFALGAGASAEMGIEAGGTAVLRLRGHVELLLLAADTVIEFSAHGFRCVLRGKVYRLFDAVVTVTGRSPDDPSSIHVSVEIVDTGFFEKIEEFGEDIKVGFLGLLDDGLVALGVALDKAIELEEDLLELWEEAKRFWRNAREEFDRAAETLKLELERDTLTVLDDALDGAIGLLREAEKAEQTALDGVAWAGTAASDVVAELKNIGNELASVAEQISDILTGLWSVLSGDKEGLEKTAAALVGRQKAKQRRLREIYRARDAYNADLDRARKDMRKHGALVQHLEGELKHAKRHIHHLRTDVKRKQTEAGRRHATMTARKTQFENAELETKRVHQEERNRRRERGDAAKRLAQPVVASSAGFAGSLAELETGRVGLDITIAGPGSAPRKRRVEALDVVSPNAQLKQLANDVLFPER